MTFRRRELRGSASDSTNSTATATAPSESASRTADERRERRTEVCELGLSSIKIPGHFGNGLQRIVVEGRVVDREAEVWNFRERHLRKLTTADKCRELLLDALDVINRNSRDSSVFVSDSRASSYVLQIGFGVSERHTFPDTGSGRKAE